MNLRKSFFRYTLKWFSNDIGTINDFKRLYRSAWCSSCVKDIKATILRTHSTRHCRDEVWTRNFKLTNLFHLFRACKHECSVIGYKGGLVARVSLYFSEWCYYFHYLRRLVFSKAIFSVISLVKSYFFFVWKWFEHYKV